MDARARWRKRSRALDLHEIGMGYHCCAAGAAQQAICPAHFEEHDALGDVVAVVLAAHGLERRDLPRRTRLIPGRSVARVG